DPLKFLGSYAGAMGMPQFMPSSLQNYALDYDQDGHIDLNNSSADIIGSVANYLAKHHWQAGIPGSFTLQTDQATQEQLDFLKQNDIRPSFSVEQLHSHGVKILNRSNSKQLSPDEVKLSFVTLENGLDAPSTYVAGTQNFFVITRYNRSSFYAMSVIEVGNAIERSYRKTRR
ncbi:MAG: lytic murein transglycosylase, partial [Saezia sp.]